jgi:hypothetical protein
MALAALAEADEARVRRHRGVRRERRVARQRKHGRAYGLGEQEKVVAVRERRGCGRHQRVRQQLPALHRLAEPVEAALYAARGGPAPRGRWLQGAQRGYRGAGGVRRAPLRQAEREAPERAAGGARRAAAKGGV